MKVRILGCGPSSGVPRIGNDWGACDPDEPRNRRTRTSVLLESDGQRLLVDCGPDLRQQMLAAEVGMSRSGFAERFASLVGQPPMQYLTYWRMQLAAQRLRESREAIAQIGYAVGYESEAAFSRAFKREFGDSPAAWRRRS